MVTFLFVFKWSLSLQRKDEMVGGCALPGPSLIVWVLMRSSKPEPPHPEAGTGPSVSPADQPHILTPQLERLSLCKLSEKPHVLLEQILGQLQGCWWGSCVELAGVGRPTPHSCKTAAHGARKEGEESGAFLGLKHRDEDQGGSQAGCPQPQAGGCCGRTGDGQPCTGTPAS